MRAVVLERREVRFDAGYQEPVPAEGEVPVRVLRAGICETDLQLMQGYMDFRGVLGHEFVGVAEAGPYRGRRVVGEINCSCGSCEICRAGLGRHCPRRTVLGILNHDGAFADRVCVPQANLHPVPEDMDDDVAVFTEPVAAAFEILEQVSVGPADRVIVLGDGRLGNLCAQVLGDVGCRLLVVGKHRPKLDLLEALGIETALLDEVVRERAADVVVDCTGSSSGWETAGQLVRPRGTIVLKTTVAGLQPLSLAPLVIDEVTVVGSRCGPFDVALDALQMGRIEVAPLISGRFPLEDTVAALEAAGTQPVLKLLLDIAAR